MCVHVYVDAFLSNCILGGQVYRFRSFCHPANSSAIHRPIKNNSNFILAWENYSMLILVLHVLEKLDPSRPDQAPFANVRQRKRQMPHMTYMRRFILIDAYALVATPVRGLRLPGDATSFNEIIIIMIRCE